MSWGSQVTVQGLPGPSQSFWKLVQKAGEHCAPLWGWHVSTWSLADRKPPCRRRWHHTAAVWCLSGKRHHTKGASLPPTWGIWGLISIQGQTHPGDQWTKSYPSSTLESILKYGPRSMLALYKSSESWLPCLVLKGWHSMSLEEWVLSWVPRYRDKCQDRW